jgi:hypothetical protein
MRKMLRDGCDLENFTGGKYLYLVFIGSYIAPCSGWLLLVHCVCALLFSFLNLIHGIGYFGRLFALFDPR